MLASMPTAVLLGFNNILPQNAQRLTYKNGLEYARYQREHTPNQLYHIFTKNKRPFFKKAQILIIQAVFLRSAQHFRQNIIPVGYYRAVRSMLHLAPAALPPSVEAFSR